MGVARATVFGQAVAAWLTRVHDSFATLGRILVMTVATLRYLAVDLVRGRFPWKEFVAQAWFMVRVSLVPTVLMAVPFGITLGMQLGALARQVGANSYVGAINGFGIFREGAPLLVALLMSTAVGSAISSDLGTRAIREEIAALEAMGISPIRRLVAPRLVAAPLVAVALCGLIAALGAVTGLLYEVVVWDGTAGAYLSSFAMFTAPSDLVLAELKAMVFGLLVAVVACDKGLSTRGGPKGVADAVNATVVLVVVVLLPLNVVLGQLFSLFVPTRVG